MPTFPRLRTFLHAHRRTCTSLGLSVLIHVLILIGAGIGAMQSPKGDMSNDKTLFVTLTSGTKKTETAHTPQRANTRPRQNKTIRIATPSPKTTTPTQTGTFNMTVADTYHVKAEAQAPANNVPENRQETAAPSSAADTQAPTTGSPTNQAAPQGTGHHTAGANTRPDYLDNPAPTYPALARRLGQEGTVLLRVDVDAKGKPTRVTVQKSSGFSLLDTTAIQAVKRWKFKPAQVAFFTVGSTVDVPITFRLAPEP
jgi:protein TonB